MTPQEFKIKHPQYSHLEGDNLWDKMAEVLLQQGNVLYADPNQVKQYLKPITLNIPQDDGSCAKSHITLEDSSTTRWLDKDGNLVRIGEPILPTVENPTTSYSMVIIDFTNDKI